jgi:hypothetical protein
MVPSGRWLRPGQRSVSWAPMSFWSGSSALPGRLNRGRRQSTAVTVRPAVLTCVFPGPQQLTATDLAGAGATCQIQARGPRVRPPGGPPSPQVGSVMMRCLRPAPSMTRRWPPTRSACRPAIRFRNVGSPRCSDVHPAAGRERESPMHDKHHRSKTRRASRSRLNRRLRSRYVRPGLAVDRRAGGHVADAW